MLETKNLTKIYKPKKGVPVKALDGISLKFPKTGMVFLLGKSGSGKSTLLNLLGGLDKYDDGEIIIKGVSSKNFKSSHFDSYRNTYVGFIFQEYNVLDEFTVGANIALALELQGRKATDAEINSILKSVDLDGYGARKPDELSGGQKQRVAIARALVKNPEIIMADEPTGALDSATGRQVLDTLKKLSRDKLVIIVSHDRDFADKYADRIIELSDGRVVGDIEFFEDECSAQEEENITFDGDTLSLKAGYHLTEEDRCAINEYIDALGKGATIHLGSKHGKRQGRATDESRIEKSDKSAFKLIKSKLPMKSAFKIGASGLKYKKIRLVITILLSCIAFGLFGLSDTFGAYDHITTCTDSIIDSGIGYASVVRAKKFSYSDGETFFRSYGYKISDDDMKKIKDSTGVEMKGVYAPVGDMSFNYFYDDSVQLSETDFDIYVNSFNGFSEVDSDLLERMGYKLTAGRLPDGSKNEIAISEYTAETFKLAGYFDAVDAEKSSDERKFEKINSSADMVGRKLSIAGVPYEITGVIDTKVDIGRYKPITVKNDKASSADKLLSYVLYNEVDYIRSYSLCSVAMVGDGFIDRISAGVPRVNAINDGYIFFTDDTSVNIDPYTMGELSDVPADYITWVDGSPRELADNELIITTDLLTREATQMGIGDNSVYFTPDGASTGEGDVKEAISSKMQNLTKYYAENYEEMKNEDGYKVVGYIDSEKHRDIAQCILMSRKNCTGLCDTEGGIYEYAVGAMPSERSAVKNFISFAYDESGDVKYPVMNAATFELDSVNSVLKSLSKVFLYVGIGFAVFAAIMLANFIGTSISHKKQEIGILRAIGSRSNDVFRIFFSESFIIAMINFVLSCIGVAVATMIINVILRNEAGILITVLSFGIRQVALLLVISLAVAAAASYLPVKRIASKRPIDAIRNR